MGLIERVDARSVYLDANIFIYAVEEVAPYVTWLTPLIEAVDRGAVRAVTSELTLAEVLVAPLRERDLGRQRAFREALRSRGGLEVVPVTRAVVLETARIRAAHRLRLPDAVHAATARLHGCGALLTNDPHFGVLAEPEVVLLSEAAGV